jgi:hypothetical protein
VYAAKSASSSPIAGDGYSPSSGALALSWAACAFVHPSRPSPRAAAFKRPPDAEANAAVSAPLNHFATEAACVAPMAPAARVARANLARAMVRVSMLECLWRDQGGTSLIDYAILVTVVCAIVVDAGPAAAVTH